ncbi:hypothetical protein MtrunA17_Chr5g0438281 [Medicago truncatula]|uniref:Uncharacterized protein n=1 Tax=Medicago truncatula TaxID=3880 RepID=A0A396I0M8_MEDTR|nr:hypothetical protein MtrunA17_Chr5g0438281 [Medicago truncatula]
MKTKLFVSVCFYALLLIFLVAIMPSEAGETKKSKINIGVHGYANWAEGWQLDLDSMDNCKKYLQWVG